MRGCPGPPCRLRVNPTICRRMLFSPSLQVTRGREMESKMLNSISCSESLNEVDPPLPSREGASSLLPGVDPKNVMLQDVRVQHTQLHSTWQEGAAHFNPHSSARPSVSCGVLFFWVFFAGGTQQPEYVRPNYLSQH